MIEDRQRTRILWTKMTRRYGRWRWQGGRTLLRTCSCSLTKLSSVFAYQMHQWRHKIHTTHTHTHTHTNTRIPHRHAGTDIDTQSIQDSFTETGRWVQGLGIRGQGFAHAGKVAYFDAGFVLVHFFVRYYHRLPNCELGHAYGQACKRVACLLQQLNLHQRVRPEQLLRRQKRLVWRGLKNLLWAKLRDYA